MIATSQGRYKKLQFFPEKYEKVRIDSEIILVQSVTYSFFICSSRNFPFNLIFYLVYLGLIMNKIKNG